jgi:DNA repair protein RecO (recombination protein O)
MKTYTSKGIIFRTLKYSETSIICDIYTLDKGLRSFIVSGVRTTKGGAKAAIFHPLNLVDITAYDHESDKLARIKEISLYHHFQSINIDVVTSSMAILMIEVCRNTIKEREANEQMYYFIEEWLVFTDNALNYNPCLHILFMLELSNLLGFGPLNNFSAEMPYFDMQEGVFSHLNISSHHMLEADESVDLNTIMLAEKHNLGSVKLSKSSRDKLIDNLLKYYKLHISSFKDLNSLPVLRDVM